MIHLTHSTKPVSALKIERKWHLIDVKNKIMGRVAPEISHLLQGKGKSTYVPYLDSGDYVVVINASLVSFSGRKLIDKIYSSYSGYPDGLKKINLENLMKKNPTQVVKNAVSGMLPKNKLRSKRMARLYVFPHDKHPYTHKFEKKINS